MLRFAEKLATSWKVTCVQINHLETNGQWSLRCSAGLSSMTLSCGTLDNTHNYEVYVEFVNTSNKATMATWYQVASMDQGEEQPSI